MNLARLQGGADDTVEAGVFRGFGVVHDHLVDGGVDHQIPLHGLLIGGGQLGHGNQQGPGAVGTGQPLQRGAHHGGGACGVEVGDVHIQIAQHRHGLLHGVGNVVELQVKKNLVPPGLDFPDDAGAFGIVQLHADLDEGLAPGELVKECESGFRGRKIAGYDNVLTHCVRLL